MIVVKNLLDVSYLWYNFFCNRQRYRDLHLTLNIKEVIFMAAKKKAKKTVKKVAKKKTAKKTAKKKTAKKKK